MEMDFQKLLLDVGKSLSDDEVEALAFLCTDLLRKNPTTVDGVRSLFSILMDENHLSAENPQLLMELLLTIQRPAILRNLGLPVQQFSSSNLISSYRKLLYHLSEEITGDELKQMKFLLKEIPRRKLEKKSTLGVFQEMERMDLINESNLDHLEKMFSSICPVLNEKIRNFKEETPRPRSSSLPFESNPTSRSYSRSGSLGEIDPRLPLSSLNSPNSPHETSQGGNRSEAVTSPPRALVGVSSLDTLEINNQNSEENFEDLDNYPMTGAKRGFCLIVSNNDFSKAPQGFKERVGTKVDEKALEEVFDWLGFDIQIHQDRNGKEIRSLFEHLGRMDHSMMDCLVCCVLSHGTEGGVYGVDGSIVLIKDLMQPFNGEMCPTLFKKPKIFFIQACQGNKQQPSIQSDGVEDQAGEICSDAKIASESLPCMADFLVGMATVPDYVSFRDRSNGTWYIQSLCQNLAKLVPRKRDLVSILTKVNDDVSRKTDNTQRKKQMPQPTFSLRKRVVFPIPGKCPPIFQ